MKRNLPDRIGENQAGRLGAICAAWIEPLSARLSAERERWALWLPVLFGMGVGAYFGLPSEPPAWAGILALAPLAGAGWLLRRRQAAMMALIVLAAVAAGFAAAQLRTQRVAAPVLERPTGAVVVEGLVEEVEAAAEGGVRVTLSSISLASGLAAPQRVRIRLKPYGPQVLAGQRISVRAMLSPPLQPVAPGAFDFARHAWFQGLGGVGFALGAAAVLPPGDEPGFGESVRIALNGLRYAVNARIRAALPGPEGGVAAALVTGETGGIPRPLLESYRDSGLAHLLSISGLHMSLLAGLVFFLVRGALALFPGVALRRPIKKWAAAAALFATFFYMLLAGAPVPTQRAFLMTGIVLTAVLLDRSALSMRLVAWAALAVLLLQPEVLVGPSFQMSFAAVVALIAAYEVLSPRLAAWRADRAGWWVPVALYVGGVAVSTLVAGTATAVYGIFHFNRFATFSLLANLLAVPLTGFAVMPFALAAMLLMPFGLEYPALAAMGLGLEAVDGVAAWVAGLPGAAVTLPVMPVAGLALFTLGGAWLCLWRGSWRLWGLALMAGGLATLALDRPPHLLVDGRGYSLGVRQADGMLALNKGGRIVRETWDRRFGPLSQARWPKEGRSDDGRLSCDRLGCVWRADGKVAALVLKDEGVEAACAMNADLVLSAVPIRQACRGARQVVDRFDLWRRGAHSIRFTPEGAEIDTVAARQGVRPWSYRPVARKKKPAAEQPEAKESGAKESAGPPEPDGGGDDGEGGD